MRAVLADDKVDFSKHAGVIAYFQREYIKTGVFDDFFFVSKQDAEEQYQRAKEFYDEMKNYLI